MAAEQVPGVYRLYYGESDTPTPEFICTAAYEAMREGHTFYTPTAGYADLREAIAAKVHELHDVSYSAAEVGCTVGAGMAIFLAIRACVNPGDNVIILSPAFSVFASTVDVFGAEPRFVPLVRDENGFVLDLERVRQSIDSRTRMLVANSPSNPTGWVISRGEQEALWELALAHDFVILSDEVYERLVFDGRVAPSFARVATDREHLLVVNSFSKTYNMTGWRLGYALGSEALIALMTKVEEFIISSPPAMVQQAGIAAIRGGEPYIEEIRETYRSRRERVIERLSGIPGLSLPNPAGAFYAFPQIEGLTDSMAFAKQLLVERKVGLAPGSAFGADGEGYLRLSFAVSDDVLFPALDIFAAYMAEGKWLESSTL